jgi:hypothetical protein
MVSMICPEKQGDKPSRLFHNQFMNNEGKWTTDFDHKATCKQDKVEILEYCKKVSRLTSAIWSLNLNKGKSIIDKNCR